MQGQALGITRTMHTTISQDFLQMFFVFSRTSTVPALLQPGCPDGVSLGTWFIYAPFRSTDLVPQILLNKHSFGVQLSHTTLCDVFVFLLAFKTALALLTICRKHQKPKRDRSPNCIMTDSSHAEECEPTKKMPNDSIGGMPATQ